MVLRKFVTVAAAALFCCALPGLIAHAQLQGTAAPTPPASTSMPPSAGTGTPSATSPAADPSLPAAAPPAPDAAPPMEPSPPPEDLAPALLPRDLTPWGMFMAADVVVKAVMIGLIFASVLTWTIWLAKSLELFGARRKLARAHDVLEAARSLGEVAKPASLASPQVARLIGAVESELRRSPDRRDVDGIKERIAARFERIEAAVGRRMQRGTSILATIGATAPFVGLFGTVWGIMNSFIGISKLHTTNLAVVAPGIAEALLATAFGLAAAIPAVVIYNMFSRSIAQYRALYADVAVEIMTLVSRDLVQRYPAAAPAAE
ncbi:MAG: tonB-system energizer ExbB [Xanthobacteraceae bacterium]|nr:tonB-system energizer ExbB [Xanthobacteraceae bacterium]